MAVIQRLLWAVHFYRAQLGGLVLVGMIVFFLGSVGWILFQKDRRSLEPATTEEIAVASEDECVKGLLLRHTEQIGLIRKATIGDAQYTCEETRKAEKQAEVLRSQ